MSTGRTWQVGDMARLSPVTVDGEPEFFQSELANGEAVALPSQDIPNNICVEVVAVNGLMVTVRIAKGGTKGAWGVVLLTQLNAL